MLAITEPHLDNTILDMTLEIEGMKFLRLDRMGRNKGGFMIYFADHLQTKHRKDLHTEGMEAIWLQVTFPSTTVSFSVICRPPDASQFFTHSVSAIERAWLKCSNIALLGDFNCDQANHDNQESRKLRSTFEMFNMENIIPDNTRITPTSSTLIDLIVTTKKELVNLAGTFPLGISDHNLVYASLRLKNRRPPPRVIKVRDYRKLNQDQFKKESAPFHIASIFDDSDDYLWAWESLFNDICDDHIPWKEVKVRSRSAPWITNEIRYKMNRRYKLFKLAISEGCPNLWSEYKQIRNEITSELWKAKALHFSKMFNDVESTKENWNLIIKRPNLLYEKVLGQLNEMMVRSH